MFKMLDLFSGKGGASSSMVGDPNWKVTTVDFEEKFNPDICADILDLSPEDFDEERCDLVWSSPPCNAFSFASIYHHWDKENDVFLPRQKKSYENLSLVYHSLYLIKGLNPVYWFLENPRAMLRKFIGESSGWVTYCQYGEDRMKPTDLWGRHPPSFKYKHCRYGAPCHIASPRGSKTGTQGLNSPPERAIIPFELSLAVKQSIENPSNAQSKLLECWIQEAT